MATLSEIILYPVKSCGGISLKRATITRAGVMTEQIYDREWMVVDQQGMCVTQREHPRMALIQPRIRLDTLELSAPGMLRLEIPLGLPDPSEAPTLEVKVWEETLKAYDCDATTAAWFSNYLGIPCRLARFHPDVTRLASEKWTGGVEAPTLFSDGYPILVASTGSLEDLNGKLRAQGREAIPMNRFRPNIVIDGIEAFEEDYAETYRAGGLLLKPVKPCPRCPMPSIDQSTGEFGPDPMDILQTYRAKAEVDGAVCFGMNSIVLEGDGVQVEVGQEMEVELAF